MSLKQNLKNHLKNSINSWKTNRKIIVLAVDDYGNIRVHSKESREKLNGLGFNIKNRFDAYDSLETNNDLNLLFETLTSVKDSKGKHAIFSPLSVPMNINFEKIIESGYKTFFNETLKETYSKIPGYENTFDLWKEGIDKNIFVPQFHGREHINLFFFNKLLEDKNQELIANINNNCFTGITAKPFKEINITGAFKFQHFKQNEELKEIVANGLIKFNEVFGYKAKVFNSPGGSEHHKLHKTLCNYGIEYIETPMIKNEHQGEGKYKKIFHKMGQKNKYNQIFLVRNCLFEPNANKSIDWAEYTTKQIQAAFYWKKPAIISSHRVNFSGHIDEKNRKAGIDSLLKLLKKVTEKWPKVEFMTIEHLADLVKNDILNK